MISRGRAPLYLLQVHKTIWENQRVNENFTCYAKQSSNWCQDVKTHWHIDTYKSHRDKQKQKQKPKFWISCAPTILWPLCLRDEKTTILHNPNKAGDFKTVIIECSVYILGLYWWSLGYCLLAIEGGSKAPKYGKSYKGLKFYL